MHALCSHILDTDFYLWVLPPCPPSPPMLSLSQRKCFTTLLVHCVSCGMISCFFPERCKWFVWSNRVVTNNN